MGGCVFPTRYSVTLDISFLSCIEAINVCTQMPMCLWKPMQKIMHTKKKLLLRSKWCFHLRVLLIEVPGCWCCTHKEADACMMKLKHAQWADVYMHVDADGLQKEPIAICAAKVDRCTEKPVMLTKAKWCCCMQKQLMDASRKTCVKQCKESHRKAIIVQALCIHNRAQ